MKQLSGTREDRLRRALLALEGLSLGDGFGERFFLHTDKVVPLINARAMPAAPWRYTDDTEMALAIYEVLERKGTIDQDLLAQVFAKRYGMDPRRGYGGGAHSLLHALCLGGSWREESTNLFDGMGSYGNGGAMRVAPLGGYFADELDRALEEAARSAAVTHAHSEGQAGAVAVAAACVYAARAYEKLVSLDANAFLNFAWECTPKSATRDGIATAMRLQEDASVSFAASVLGSGMAISAQDTVPFSLWCVSKSMNDFVQAQWLTVSGLGDRDTTCAIVGGIVALFVGEEGLPAEWLAAREPLQFVPTERNR